MKLKPNKFHFLVVSLVAAILLVASLFLLARLKVLKDAGLKNTRLLEDALPHFSDQKLKDLQEEIRATKLHLTKLAAMLDPKSKWFKKDYQSRSRKTAGYACRGWKMETIYPH